MDAEERELWKRYHQACKQGNGKEYKQALHIFYLPFLRRMARSVNKRLYRNVIEQGDLENIGFFALDERIEKFDPAQSESFEEWASTRIRGSMIDELRRQGFEPRTFRDRRRYLENVAFEIASDLGHYPDYDKLAFALGKKALPKIKEDAVNYQNAQSQLRIELEREPLVREIIEQLRGDNSRIHKNYNILQKAKKELAQKGIENPSDSQLAKRIGYQIMDTFDRPKINFYGLDRYVNHEMTGRHIKGEIEFGGRLRLQTLLETQEDYDPVKKAQKLDILRILTRGFSDQERLAVLLYFVEGLLMREIGEKHLGVCESKVSKDLVNIKKVWRTITKEKLEELGILEL